VLGATAHASVCCERTKSPPFGLAGGAPGAPARVALRVNGSERELPAKGAFTAPAGSQIDFLAPGAGGYGPPRDRDRERLRDDVINEYVSREAAERDYGIADAAAIVCPDCSPRPR
jgi:N-methylhydantoinase B